MSLADLIYHEAKTLPDNLHAEVLDFIGYLKTHHRVETMTCPPRAEVASQEHTLWCERLQRALASQPMTESDTVIQTRQESRY